MKATGIVRRIDDLGRVVVPKEIRRTMRIREGDPLEIFTDNEGEIILKKYSPIGELSPFSKQYAEALAQCTTHVVTITDRDRHIAVAGGLKKELYQKPISKALDELIQNRTSLTATAEDKTFISLTEEDAPDLKSQVICPIIAEGDAIGAVIITSKEAGVKMGQVEQKLALAAASFLGRQLEQ